MLIVLTLKHFFKDTDVTLVDISEKALKVAEDNAKTLGLNVNFIKSDWFSNIPIDKYDIIVSNPPYIKTEEEIEDIVKNNEPHLALYGGKDGLDCYRNILKDINNYLNVNYLIAFEIGYLEGEELKKIIKNIIPNSKITIKKDLSNKDRMLFVEKKID